jgi:hypothetical protein
MEEAGEDWAQRPGWSESERLKCDSLQRRGRCNCLGGPMVCLYDIFVTARRRTDEAVVPLAGFGGLLQCSNSSGAANQGRDLVGGEGFEPPALSV